MQNIRQGGILLHVTSLDGPFGTGVMGKEAYSFIDKAARMDFRVWQVLPLGHVDAAGSPYCSVSAFAGNPSLIDPRILEEQGLLTHDEVEENYYSGDVYHTKHDFALKKRLACLRKAFSRIDGDLKNMIELFCQQNTWVKDYALFTALKDANDQKPWWEWNDEHARYEKALCHADEFKEETDFYTFVQFVFFTQWRQLKEYANEKNIAVLGDMPIYVSRDSVDVWSNISLFKINPDSLAPDEVAGVPPDYFSEDGQLWGNPLYDWDKMKECGYSWWVERLRCSLKLYDTVRIDHFRAFASYWAVPAESETAKNGEWKTGPGTDLFNEIKKQLKEADIIAEDLGVFGEDVVKLLEETEFPGMRVIQFGFDPNGDSTHLPHNYPANCVAYVGTHDNNTILGWLWNASESERAYALRYCCFGGNNWGEGGSHSGSCRAVTEAVWRSSANVAIVAVQDMCGFGEDARMNTPGTCEDNWSFRLSREALDGIDEGYYREINNIYRRTYTRKFN